MCTICAEEIRPDVVSSRERHNRSRYGLKRSFSPGFEQQSYGIGKHR